MKFSLFVPSANPFASPEMLRALARQAEERDFDALWVPEHVVLFDEYASSYPYAADGRIPAPPGSGMLDPFGTLTFLAACTETIRLGTAICLLPQRNPVYTAHEVATADWLSNGRIDFGIGIGWLEEEFVALGVPWPARGKRTDDYIGLLKALWTEDVVTYDGEFHSVRNVWQDPKPVQKPYPPLIIGGESDAALRRVVAHGDGWLGFGHMPDTAAERIARLGTLLEEDGRSIADVQVKVCPYFNPIDEQAVEQFAEAGVGEIVGFFFADSAESVGPALDGLSALQQRAQSL
jgi:probable F420-dependent oxidoreductase